MERVDALRSEVEALRQEIAPPDGPSLNDRIDLFNERIELLAREMHRRTAWWRAAVAIGVVLLIAITGGAFLLELRTRAEIADSNRKLCPMVALLIPAPATGVPSTTYGQQLADQARLLYAAYGCPHKNGA